MAASAVEIEISLSSSEAVRNFTHRWGQESLDNGISIDIGWNFIKSQLTQFKAVIVIRPKVILQATVKERNTIYNAVSIYVGVDVE
jgi:hypothetical protein